MPTYSKVSFNDPFAINESDSCDANDIVISGISGKVSQSFNLIYIVLALDKAHSLFVL